MLGSCTSSRPSRAVKRRLRPSQHYLWRHLPLFSKIDVNGEHARRSIKTDCRRAESGGPKAAVYERMASKGRAPLYVDDILWNFEKFLVDRRATSFSASLRI